MPPQAIVRAGTSGVRWQASGYCLQAWEGGIVITAVMGSYRVFIVIKQRSLQA